MPSQKGRDLLLKIGDGGETETFTAIGAARLTSMAINNRPVDATSMGDGGLQTLVGDAGIQSMQLRLEGLFKDSASEELLRDAAFSRSACNYRLVFPNGDAYAASFVVEEYARTGTHDGLETFSVTLVRSGGGTFTSGE